MDPSEKFTNLLKEGCWLKCEVLGNQLKVAKLPTRDKSCIPLAEEEVPQERNYSHCDFLDLLDEKDIPSPKEKSFEDNADFSEIAPPEGGEKLEIDMHSADEWLSITLNENYPEFQARDNGKAIALFIINILSSTVVNRYLMFKDITYKKVIIFGIITEIFEGKRKTITVDDGTGQLKCYVEHGLNERSSSGNYENNDLISSERVFHEMDQIFISKLKELSCNLPTFEKLDIGDRVCISGNISFHNGYFYLFVEKLERHYELKKHISFMKRVFYLFENSYYSDNKT